MLTRTEKKQLQRFQKLLSLPKWKYVLVYGVLMWAVPIAIGLSFAKVYFTRDITLFEMLRGELWINLIFFCAGGVAYSLFMRRFLDRVTQRLMQKEEDGEDK